MKINFRKYIVVIALLMPFFSHAAVIPVNMGLSATDAKTNGAVTQLQIYLGVRPVTGYFGTITRAKLIAFQRNHGLPQTGTFNRTTADYVNNLLNQTVSAPTSQALVATTTWEKGTTQAITIPAAIQNQNHTVSISLQGQDAFAHDDIYFIVLDQPNKSTYTWTVATSTAQSVRSDVTYVPIGKYSLRICGLTCFEYPNPISIATSTANTNSYAVMASMVKIPTTNYTLLKAGYTIDEFDQIHYMDTKYAYVGSTLHVYARTKGYVSYVPLVRIRAYNDDASYVLLSTSSQATDFPLVVGESFTIPTGTYNVEVCIAAQCNVTLEKLSIGKGTSVNQTFSKISYYVPPFLTLTTPKTIVNGTSSVSRIYTESGELDKAPYPLVVTDVFGDIANYKNPQSTYNLSYANGNITYTNAAGIPNSIQLVKLSTGHYVVVEARSSIIQAIANSVRSIN